MAASRANGTTPSTPACNAQHYRELLDINRLITSSLDPDEILSTLVMHAARLLNAQSALLLLREDRALRIAAVHELPGVSTELRIPLGPGVMEAIRTVGQAAGVAGFVGVPLVIRGETIGVLAVYRREQAGPDEGDEELLSALADQAVIALENARTYHRQQIQAQALRESEELFRLAMEEAPIGVALVGLDGRFLRVNNALCEMLGYSRDELTQLTFQAITHPDDLDVDVALAERLARGDIPRYQLAKRYIRKNGTIVDIMLSGSVARTLAGAPLYFIAHVEDVTERKRAEDRARQAQERLDLALRGADLGTWDWNVVTGEVIFNARWAEMRGYRLDEIRPHVETWLAGVHPDDLPRVDRVLSDYFAGRRDDYEVEHRVRTKSGSWIWILDRGRVFARDERGRAIRMVGTELDITERKRLEQSLREANADLDRAQSVAKTGSWRLDVRRDVLAWSAENYRIFGVKPGTPMTYELFLERVHPDDRDYVDRMWKAGLEGAPYDIEHRLLIDDTVSWVREKAALEYDEHGGLIGGIGITQDITERKRVEEALQLAEARSSGILAVSADAIISIDDDYRITHFNAGARAIFGYAPEEAIGASLDLLIPERLRDLHRQHVQQFAQGGEAARRMGDGKLVIVGRRKNGEEFPADASISKLDVGGMRVLTVALRDISEQTRIADEQRFLAEAGSVLAESLDYADTLTRVAELAVEQLAEVCIVDIVEPSGEIRRLKVVSRDERLKQACERLERYPLDRNRRYLLQHTLASKRPLLVSRIEREGLASFAQEPEHLAILLDIRPISMITVPLLAYDKLVGGLALLRTTSLRVYDAADVSFAEELARRAALAIENARLYQTARRAIQARDDVLGIVAHDLRNPLNAVRLQAQLFHLYGGESHEQARKAADTIDRATRRMDRLIEDLLDVSRVEAGRLHIEKAHVAPAELIADFVEMQRPNIESATLELRVDVEPDVPEIWADRNRILQALENLVGNACKFTPKGGRITIAASRHGGEVVFWVSDTGSGIPADALPHVFDRFWQARRTDRRGAGLGLAITRGIVEAHGGRIWVDSTLGKGTTFYFSIPLAPSAHVALESSAPTLH